jgi:hypothetical protein
MTDYQPLLARALSNLQRNTFEVRKDVYERARQALVNQLRTMNPPLPEADITRERMALEEAIRRVEAIALQADANAARGQPARREVSPAPPPPPRAGAATRMHPPPDSAEMESARPTRQANAEPLPPVSGVELDQAALEDAEYVPQEAVMRPRPLRQRGAELAREDKRKARRAKFMVAAIVLLLIAVATGLGFMQRDRILAFFGMGSMPSLFTGGERSKVPDRVASDPSAQARPPGQAAPAGSVTAVAQRAVLYEENPGAGQQPEHQIFVGTAVWRTETVALGPGRSPDMGLRLDIEIPDRRMTVSVTFRRNPDTTLPASHTVEVQFTIPNDPFGGVSTMPGIRAKNSETAQGAPLAGLTVRVTPGFFLVGLSAIEGDKERNIQLLRERPWLDIPFVYNNGRRAVLAVEKGTPGERALNEVLMAWGQ